MLKKIILITGACRGIGFETAKQLGRLGHCIILSGRNENDLNQAIQNLKDAQMDAQGLVMDVTSQESIRKASDIFGKQKLKLDVLINNAAVLFSEDDSILHGDETMQQLTFLTNSSGPLKVSRAFLPYMNSPSRIINISSSGGSMTGTVGGWSPAYCASKSLLNAITRQMAHELQAQGISVNAADPGWVRTKMGGASAPRTVSEGAATPVWLATEAPASLSGNFFRDKTEIPW